MIRPYSILIRILTKYMEKLFVTTLCLVCVKTLHCIMEYLFTVSDYVKRFETYELNHRLVHSDPFIVARNRWCAGKF